jgi:hypothetical protein
MPIMEDRQQERTVRDYPRRDYDSGDYLIRDRDYAQERRRATSRTMPIITASSSLTTGGGVVVAVLAILALIGVIPRIMMSIAGIVFGIAMLAEGLGIAGEYRKLGRWLAEARSERVELAGGTGIEVAVGFAAIVLGILALIGVAAATLIPVLVIAGGVGLMIAVGTLHRVNDLKLTSMGASDFGRVLHHESVSGAGIVETFGGLAAVVLGILALVWNGTTPAGYGLLAEIGLICLGVAVAIGGFAISGRSMMLYRRR